MRNRFFSLLATAIVVAAGRGQAQTAPDGGLLALGSGSMEQVVQAWRDDYRAKVPGFRMEIRPEGSGAAPEALNSGLAQLGLMSREMKPAEVAAFKAKHGYPPTRVAVAMDALVVLVNKNNPIHEIRMDQLDAVYSSGRALGWPKDILLWGDLGLNQPGWNNRPIVRWDRPEASGTRAFFHELVLKGNKGKADTLTAMEESGIDEELFIDQAAIGYGSMSDVFSALKAIPVVPVGTKVPVEPTLENVGSGAYPMSRFLFVYLDRTPGKPLPAAVEAFLKYTLSPQGQKVVKSVGQVPLPDELIKVNLRRVD